MKQRGRADQCGFAAAELTLRQPPEIAVERDEELILRDVGRVRSLVRDYRWLNPHARTPQKATQHAESKTPPQPAAATRRRRGSYVCLPQRGKPRAAAFRAMFG